MRSQIYTDNIITDILQPRNTLNDEGDVTCAAQVTLNESQSTTHLINFTDHLLKSGRAPFEIKPI